MAPEINDQIRNLDFLATIPLLISNIPIMAINTMKRLARLLIEPTIHDIAIIPKRIKKTPLLAGIHDLS